MSPWRHKLHEVIFEADTAAGRWFDTLLIISILTTVGFGDITPQTPRGSFWPRSS